MPTTTTILEPIFQFYNTNDSPPDYSELYFEVIIVYKFKRIYNMEVW